MTPSVTRMIPLVSLLDFVDVRFLTLLCSSCLRRHPVRGWALRAGWLRQDILHHLQWLFWNLFLLRRGEEVLWHWLRPHFISINFSRLESSWERAIVLWQIYPNFFEFNHDQLNQYNVLSMRLEIIVQGANSNHYLCWKDVRNTVWMKILRHFQILCPSFLAFPSP